LPRADYNPSAYDRSRRSSADSDLRSLYQPQALEPRPYLPLNQSTASLGYSYGGHAPSFTSASPALGSRRSTESMRVLPTQPKVSPSYPADRALSFSAGERPDLYRGLDSSMLPTPVSAFSSSQPSLAMSVRPPSYSSVGGGTGGHPGSGPAGSALVPRHSPVVYPALLSRVAAAFRERIAPTERIKDGLVYQDAFDGRDAVDRIAYIIKTSDRNLALLLGRALDAQKFFHDVTYAHRLRDSPHEIYQFKARLASSFQLSSDDLVPGDQQRVAQHPHAPHSAAALAQAVGVAQAQARQPGSGSGAGTSPYDPRRSSVATTQAAAGPGMGDGGADEDDSPLPSGVFTLLTDCYSPTCTRDRLCYSIACPRRLEQQARLNLKREGLSGGLEDVGKLKRSASLDSLVELRVRLPSLSLAVSLRQYIVLTLCFDTRAGARLAVDPLGPAGGHRRDERLGEEAPGVHQRGLLHRARLCARPRVPARRASSSLFVVVVARRGPRADSCSLRSQFWIKPLRSSNIIPEARREDFVTQVFWNVLEIYAVNVRLVDLLNKRAKQAHVVDHIGDIFLDFVPHFAPYVKYGAHQLYGKYEFEKEKGSNPAFAKFVDVRPPLSSSSSSSSCVHLLIRSTDHRKPSACPSRASSSLTAT